MMFHIFNSFIPSPPNSNALQGWSYSFVIRWRPDIASPNVFPAASDAFWQRLGEDDFVTNHHKQSNFIPFDQWFIVRRARAGAVLSFVDTVVSCIKGESLRTQPPAFFSALYFCDAPSPSSSSSSSPSSSSSSSCAGKLCAYDLAETGWDYIHLWVECFLAWHLQLNGLKLQTDLLTIEFNRHACNGVSNT